jgi:hypothetical protein
VRMVRDWDPRPFTKVYPKDELLDAFPDVPMVPAGPIGNLGPGTLMVVVIDVEGETAYALPDPRASNWPPRMRGARHCDGLRLAQLAQGAELELARPFAGDLQPEADLRERQRLARQAREEHQDGLLAVVQPIYPPQDLGPLVIGLHCLAGTTVIHRPREDAGARHVSGRSARSARRHRLSNPTRCAGRRIVEVALSSAWRMSQSPRQPYSIVLKVRGSSTG